MVLRYCSIIVIGIIGAILYGCNKITSKELAGTYECTIHMVQTKFGVDPYDTTFTTEFLIKQDGDELIIPSGARIHVDSLQNENIYAFNDCCNDYSTIQFKNDSMFYHTVYHLLENHSDDHYIGVKKK